MKVRIVHTLRLICYMVSVLGTYMTSRSRSRYRPLDAYNLINI